MKIRGTKQQGLNKRDVRDDWSDVSMTSDKGPGIVQTPTCLISRKLRQ
jgi:hypothetical protein